MKEGWILCSDGEEHERFYNQHWKDKAFRDIVCPSKLPILIPKIETYSGVGTPNNWHTADLLIWNYEQFNVRNCMVASAQKLYFCYHDKEGLIRYEWEEKQQG